MGVVGVAGTTPKVPGRPRTFVPSTGRAAVRRFAAVIRAAAIIVCEEIAIMAERIRRAWRYALAIAPIAAIVLVEAAMRRW